MELESQVVQLQIMMIQMNRLINPHLYHQRTKNRVNCAMIIDILTDTIMKSLPNNHIVLDTISMDTHAKIKDLSSQSIIAKYTLDFKQSVAFEIMATSFILKSLEFEKITEQDIQTFFEENHLDRVKYTNNLLALKKT